MIAAEIARALSSAYSSGRWWRCRCPVHGSRGATLALRNGESGLIVKCFAGCDPLNVLAELRRRGLIEDRGERRLESRSIPPRHDNIHRIAVARRLWEAGQNALGSPVQRYLQSRGIQIPPPPCLRWAPACRHPNGRVLWAMLSRIDDTDGELIGIHRTYLRPNGSGKAAVEPVKAMLGRAAGGAVRLAPAAEVLMIGEGIETCLAAMTATGLPGWSAISAGGIEVLTLPALIKTAIILADHDRNARGERAARTAAQRWLAEGRQVEIALPPEVGCDFNDVLVGRAYGRIAETSVVAA
jgi:putative DNA primase/helicase